MTEANTTYSWQMPCGVDAKSLCASIPGSSTNNIHADNGVYAWFGFFRIGKHIFAADLSLI